MQHIFERFLGGKRLDFRAVRHNVLGLRLGEFHDVGNHLRLILLDGALVLVIVDERENLLVIILFLTLAPPAAKQSCKAVSAGFPHVSHPFLSQSPTARRAPSEDTV